MLKITFAKSPAATLKTAIIPVYKEGKLSESAKSHKTLITHTIENHPNFKGKLGQTLVITMGEKNDFDHIILLGLDDPKKLNAIKAQEAGGKLFVALKSLGTTAAGLLIEEDAKVKDLSTTDLAANIAYGLKLRSYTYLKYKAKPKKPAPEFKSFSIISAQSTTTKKTYSALESIAEGVFTARDLVNAPPNDLYPESYAKFIQNELKPLGVSVEIIDEKKMAKLGMEAILAVGKGSERQPRMVVMKWNGAKTSSGKSSEAPIALVGKGVTFDTGGISLKPGAGMDEMKMDMGGSAAVIGTMKALALGKVEKDVVAIVGLAENMPSHNAYRPGDIIGSLSGKTIEVLNTDAEGRLVLADCLTHIQQKFKPKYIIDLATLTGAMMVALGHEYCGTFVNDSKLWKDMDKASDHTGEKLWRMPLDKVFKNDMVSNVADLQNLAKSGRLAGACTAAGFLEHFIENDTPWAHMDIAGTAWRKSDQPTAPKYGTGFGVRLLTQLITEG
ncbi:MAG: leucyl aminopeptidase [Alphaproteobacteria bacterium]|nr:leucyl aminopeptidase [Alphaproteobacteria bacterium]